jgi:hypothetical protein
LVFFQALLNDLVSVPAAGIVTPTIPYGACEIKYCGI